MQIKRNVLLNPGPATTTDTVKMAQIVPDICPREKEFVSMMKQMREDLVRIVHGDLNKYTSVLFCGSGTITMDVCINSLLPKGKKILIINNGTYSMRAVEICEYYNLPFVNFDCPIDEIPDLNQVEQILKENQDIALVYTTHNETGTGILNPIKEIGFLVHKYSAVFIVDTIFTYAMKPIDIEKDNIDFCMASAQKGLMAMTGLSFVIGNTELIKKSAAYPKRSYYCNLYMQYHFLKQRDKCTLRRLFRRFMLPVRHLMNILGKAKNQNGKDIQRCLRRYTQDLINSASRTLSGGIYRQVLVLQ